VPRDSEGVHGFDQATLVVLTTRLYGIVLLTNDQASSMSKCGGLCTVGCEIARYPEAIGVRLADALRRDAGNQRDVRAILRGVLPGVGQR